MPWWRPIFMYLVFLVFTVNQYPYKHLIKHLHFFLLFWYPRLLNFIIRIRLNGYFYLESKYRLGGFDVLTPRQHSIGWMILLFICGIRTRSRLEDPTLIGQLRAGLIKIPSLTKSFPNWQVVLRCYTVCRKWRGQQILIVLSGWPVRCEASIHLANLPFAPIRRWQKWTSNGQFASTCQTSARHLSWNSV